MPKNSGGVDQLTGNELNVTTPLNTSINQLTDLIRRFYDVGVSGTGNYTLKVTDAEPEARSRIVRLTGTLTGARTILWPVTEAGRVIFFWNATTGAFTLTVKTTAGSSGVEIPQGFGQLLGHDDVSILPMANAAYVVNTLYTNLIAFWKLDEASGTRNDSVSTNHLTDNNTVTQVAGKVGNAAQFTATNSEYLSIADNAALSTGDIDFTIVAWVYLDTKTAGRDMVAKFGATGNFEYILAYDNAGDRFNFAVSNDGTAVVVVSANTFGSPSLATWYFIVCYHDSVNNLIGISVNNGAFNTQAHTTGVFNSTAAFQLGSRVGGGNYMDGRIDAVGFYKRMLTAGEITALYNGGSGREFPT